MKQKKKRIIALLLAAALSLGMLSGCSAVGGGESSEMSDPQSSAESTPNLSSSSEPETPDLTRNPITGETAADPSVLTLRPVAVMINNIKDALPQRGLADADLIYELPVEGPVTRLMAVFSDYRSLPDVGSIRSARHDYVELALALDAFYVHIGKSTQAQEAMDRTDIDHIDGTKYTNVSFWKDEARAQTRSSEHCWFTDGEHIQNGINKLEIDMSTQPRETIFNFAVDSAEVLAGETKPAQQVTAPLSGSVTASFTYDSASGTYRKGEYGANQIDENTGKAAQVKNVFLMYTTVKVLADGLHKDADLSQGKGYYISDGKAQAVTFKRVDEKSPIQVLGTDGAEVKVNPGKTWFCVGPNEYADKLVME